MTVQAPSTSPRRPRAELIAIAIFVAVDLFAPLATEELCPLTRSGIFTDAPERIAIYEVLDPEGEELPVEAFGLRRNYTGLRGFNVERPGQHPAGVKSPASIDVVGAVPSEPEIRSAVQAGLAKLKLPYVDVTVDAVEPDASGKLTQHHVFQGRISRSAP